MQLTVQLLIAFILQFTACSGQNLDPICLNQGQCSAAALQSSGMPGIKVLQYIPTILSTSITLLDVQGNQIPSLNATDLDRYPLLERV